MSYSYYSKANKQPNITKPKQFSLGKIGQIKKPPRPSKYNWAVNRYINAQGWDSKGVRLRGGGEMLNLIRLNDLQGHKTCSMGIGKGNIDLFIQRYCSLRKIKLSEAGNYVEVNGVTEPANKYIDKSFLDSPEWRRVRLMVLKRDGARCACCGTSALDGERMTVDHIKPRLIYPQLALSMNNLQVLCWPCNQGKGNWDMTDWRPIR